ncbi:MAG: nuclear transport factor 2 family protein, partial [Chloroflexi bacterium]|nr:nuclear transport factor 2 family protein [Chloroflexota bacterium]
MDRAGFREWLQRYVDAWRLNDPAAIGDLFSTDVRYAYDPFDEALAGRAALIASWLEDPDEAGSWQAEYDVLAVDGDVFVAHGRTRYLTDDRTDVDREFANIFVCRFDPDGRCREF